MRGALAVGIVGMVGVANGFVIPGPSKVVSGRATRQSTSQVIFMGRGDMRTAKGKRTRASYGVSRPKPKKKIAKVFIDGARVDKPAPATRTWDEVDEQEYEPAEGEEAAEGVTVGAGADVASYYTASEEGAAAEEPVIASDNEVESADEIVEDDETEAEAEPTVEGTDSDF